jgi:hypothetical protein
MFTRRAFARFVYISLFAFLAASGRLRAGDPVRVLFLGDAGHHRPAERFAQLQPVLAARGIELVYSDRTSDLNRKTLDAYAAVAIYANIEKIAPAEEQALLEFVAGGRGLVALHCASYCFLNSDKYVELVGAQFQSHGTGVFRTAIAEPDHPVVRGFGGFESWDETYVHRRHNPDRTVLEYRGTGPNREPWTWVRRHGRGRVFYTAWGHDERTWGNPGFANLVERGIHWAAGGDLASVPPFRDRPDMTTKRTDVRPFEYAEAKVPFYPAGERWGTMGEPIRKMQRPLEPAESLKHMVTPVGFEVRLFAAEPQIGGKPICMNWDERGRLWVAETVDYPNELQPEGQGRDRIRICEDTDGDGRADKFTVFADRLSLPTSLAFYRGGVIVHQPPHTLYLKDTSGDDVADERRILFTGWATNDTHAGPSNLNYGLDNWIYGIVGYAGFEGVVGGEPLSFRQGFYRFRPDGSKLEFLRNTNNNSWGVGFSEEGVLFGSTANGNPSVYMPIPNRYYESVRGWSSSVLGSIAASNRFEPITDQVRQVDFHGGFTAAAGHALYTARVYPREYWNRTAFVAEPTGHLLATFQIEPAGADYRSRNSWNLLASDDEWTGPIMAEVGPDGNVWVIDWYNYIVQHNPTPAGYRTGRGNAYEIDLRDKTHGRIYRVVYAAADATRGGPRAGAAGGDPRAAAPDSNTRGSDAGPGGPSPDRHRPTSLRDAAPDALVAALRSDNLFWRRHAQRLLLERGRRDVVPALVELVKDRRVDDIGLNPAAIHALWTLHGLGAIDRSNRSVLDAVYGALKHPSAGVRRNALLVAPRTDEATAAILASGALRDSNGQAQLAALLSLAEMPASRAAGEAVATVLADPGITRERWLRDAATAAAAAHDVHCLRALARRAKLDTQSEPPAASGVTTELNDAVVTVATHYARGDAAATVGSLLGDLSQASTPLAGPIVTGLARGWPKDRPVRMDAALEWALGKLLSQLPASSRGSLVMLAARWGSTRLQQHAAEIAGTLLVTVRDEKAPERSRIAAAGQLIEFRPADAGAALQLLELVTPRTGPELARGLIEAVGRSESPDVAPATLGRMPAWTPSLRAAALRMLLGRTDWTLALLAHLEAGKLDPAELSADQKQALAAHPDQMVATRAKTLLARTGGLPNADRQAVLDELTPLTKQRGDPVAGKAMYTKHCAKCHVHGSEGTRVGPDLTGMAVHPKLELLTNIIDPSRSVEGNYRAYTLATNDGRVLTGLLASETRTSLEIFDVEGKKHLLQRDELDELIASNKSLMPDGFEKQMTPDELAHLLEFLAQPGKYLPLDLRKVATVVSTRGMFYSEDSPAERLVFRDWSPKEVEGVPFQLVDPQGDRVPNAVLLYGPTGRMPPRMPRSVSLPCHVPARAIHLLSGVSGWGFPLGEKGSVTMIVRLHYADGQAEDHALRNGEHFADYIRRVDVPGSKLAFLLRGQQLRYLAVQPQRDAAIDRIELVKGPDATAPVVMAVTVETR